MAISTSTSGTAIHKTNNRMVWEIPRGTQLHIVCYPHCARNNRDGLVPALPGARGSSESDGGTSPLRAECSVSPENVRCAEMSDKLLLNASPVRYTVCFPSL